LAELEVWTSDGSKIGLTEADLYVPVVRGAQGPPVRAVDGQIDTFAVTWHQPNEYFGVKLTSQLTRNLQVSRVKITTHLILKPTEWQSARLVLVSGSVKSVAYIGLDVNSIDFSYSNSALTNVQLSESDTSMLVPYTWTDTQFAASDLTRRYFLPGSPTSPKNYRDPTNGNLYKFDGVNFKSMSLEAYAKGGFGHVFNCTICMQADHPAILQTYPLSAPVPIPSPAANHLIVYYVRPCFLYSLEQLRFIFDYLRYQDLPTCFWCRYTGSD
jgi:hypothetical protein